MYLIFGKEYTNQYLSITEYGKYLVECSNDEEKMKLHKEKLLLSVGRSIDLFLKQIKNNENT